MTEKEIIEGNKILAAFMDVKIGVEDYSYRPGVTEKLKVEHLNYHASWGWLMPVWVKFKNLYIKGITATHYHKQVCASFGNAILSGDIENAWSDAVMAINWYNTQTPQP